MKQTNLKFQGINIVVNEDTYSTQVYVLPHDDYFCSKGSDGSIIVQKLGE
jgi:hypothetical protein